MTLPLLLALAASAGGSVERVRVHGKSLEGNLIGDSPDRDVSVYLPPSYKTEPARRYPVVYLLHGFTDDDAQWFGFKKHWIHLPSVLDRAFASPAAREMIVVMPNAYNSFQGSLYSSSVTIGDWETLVARELVAYIDGRYRTLPQAASRGLAGHSMGGYGTLRIGMKHPEVFSSLYLLSPCCLSSNTGAPPGRTGAAGPETVRSLADLEKADFFTKARLASAAAWSPNPKKPPLFLDLPVENGQVRPEIAAKWSANAPLAMLDQYVPNLKRLSAIAFDAGDGDRGIAAAVQVLDRMLTDYGIQHTFEIYEGDHTNRIAERIETRVAPYFSRRLAFDRVRP